MKGFIINGSNSCIAYEIKPSKELIEYHKSSKIQINYNKQIFLKDIKKVSQMSNFEFISYKTYPHDQYTKAIAEVQIDGKYNVSYAFKQFKDGGTKWAPASHSVATTNDPSVKKTFVNGFECDSSKFNTQLENFIKENVTRLQGTRVQMSGSALVAPQATQGGGSPDEPLPF